MASTAQRMVLGSRRISASLRVRKHVRQACHSQLSRTVPPSSPNWKVDPQMPPERLSQRGATELGAELSLPLQSESEEAKIARNSAANSTLSLTDIKSFYNQYLVWLCWQSEANLSLAAI